ncbi:diguanylate cyclase [Geobacter sp.]|uniref:GGDEF domain-containing protein n=1 Tax=Geobacter sp. TaxID=46610 RepID=UPI0027B9A6C3|nr:diguanylate cyclase [Geobacter sp.]
MPSNDTQINLVRYLSRRLYPLSLGICCLISLVFPATFFFIEYNGHKRTAGLYAQNTADHLKALIDETSLWKYQIYRFTELTRDLSTGKEVISIDVFDANGSPIANYRYASHKANAWWNRWAPVGEGFILYNNQRVGRVEIRISQRALLIKSTMLLIVCSSIGALLAFLSYYFPIRVVRRQEAEIQTLFDNVRRGGEESERLQHVAQESEKRFRDLVQGLDAIVWEADPVAGRFTFVSHQGEVLFLIPVDQWLVAADFFMDQIHPDDRQRVAEAYQRSVAKEADCQIEYRRQAVNGSVVWVRDNFRVVSDEEGHKQLRGVMVDITRRRHDEETLHQVNEELNQSVHTLEQRNKEISNLHEMGEMFQLCRNLDEAYRVIVVTADKLFPGESGALFMLNPSRNLLESTCEWGPTSGHERLFAPDSCWALRRGRMHVAAGGKGSIACKNTACGLSHECICIPMTTQGETIGVIHFEGAATGESTIGTTDGLSDGKYQLAVTMTEHVALALANLRLRETLRNQSIRDPLTGLYNRRYMEETLAREISLAERKGTSFGVIMIDLDHFKNFNDTHGHDAGDTLLKEFGAFILRHIREYDVACRYGGEEFTCILPDATMENAMERAEELRKQLMSLHVEHIGRTLELVTMSVGVAVYPDHGGNGATLIKAADDALYRAKKEGRNRVNAARGGETKAGGIAGHLSNSP